MIHILFVCLGNICRSPMAEGVFIKLVKDHALENYFTIDSAGTSSYHLGALADPRMQDTALQHNIHLIHKARQVKKDDLHAFHYIVAMDQQNLKDVLLLKEENSTAKVVLMRDFDPEKDSSNVPDPYFGGQKGFDEVYEILYRSCNEFLQSLIELHGLPKKA